MQSSLFDETAKEVYRWKPLAVRMRPCSLAEVMGQSHLLGTNCLLPKLIAQDTFGSLLFYGPPGSGKTTLAEVVAHETRGSFIRINAVTSNVAQLREVLHTCRKKRAEKPPVLFIDEIHRFNRAQQDLLLPDVEEGTVRLIGATTHTPSFSLIAPLLSRSHLFHLEPLDENVIVTLLDRALSDVERGLGATRCTAGEKVLEAIARFSGGDARRALGALETIVLSKPLGADLTLEDVAFFAKERTIHYDANETEHYDTISAFIKSIRGSDPDAALYWMTKMLEGGEDPRYIARRLVILASEDVGLADSRALPLAMAAFQACECIGLPECALNLAHVTLFLATAPKSNSATEALSRARAALRDSVQPVPVYLREALSRVGDFDTKGEKYLYSHQFEEGISGQEYLLRPLCLYQPKHAGAEAAIAERLQYWKKLKEKKKVVKKD